MLQSLREMCTSWCARFILCPQYPRYCPSHPPPSHLSDSAIQGKRRYTNDSYTWPHNISQFQSFSSGGNFCPWRLQTCSSFFSGRGHWSPSAHRSAAVGRPFVSCRKEISRRLFRGRGQQIWTANFGNPGRQMFGSLSCCRFRIQAIIFVYHLP